MVLISLLLSYQQQSDRIGVLSPSLRMPSLMVASFSSAMEDACRRSNATKGILERTKRRSTAARTSDPMMTLWDVVSYQTDRKRESKESNWWLRPLTLNIKRIDAYLWNLTTTPRPSERISHNSGWSVSCWRWSPKEPEDSICVDRWMSGWIGLSHSHMIE